MDGSEHSLPDPEKRLCCEPQPETLSLFGDDSSTVVSTIEPDSHKPVSTVRPSATSRAIKAARSFSKRTQLLIASGLIAGITPTSIRQRCGANCLEVALFGPVGATFVNVDGEREPEVDC